MNTRSWKSRAMAVVVRRRHRDSTGALPAAAAPVLTNTAVLKQALPGNMPDVLRWRGGGGLFFGGLLAGGLIGAAIARPYYYGYPAYYGYGYGYGYAPYAYGYRTRTIHTATAIRTADTTTAAAITAVVLRGCGYMAAGAAMACAVTAGVWRHVGDHARHR